MRGYAPRQRKGPLGMLLVSAAALLLLAGCGRSGDETVTVPPTDPKQDPLSQVREFRLSVRDGEVVGGPQEWVVTEGVEVSIVVDLDQGDEVRLEGTGMFLTVPDQSVGTFKYVADEPGTYDVVLEEADLTVATLRVEPEDEP